MYFSFLINVFVSILNTVQIENYLQYLYSFRQVDQMNDKKYSATKTYQWKPKEYLSNTFYKRGKTFFSSQFHEPQPVDPFRKTDIFVRPKNIKDFTVQCSPNKDGEQRIKRRKDSKGSKGMVLKIERSPYLSNTSQIQKMLRLLVPVKGPNQSLKLQIKRHNDLNLRNAENLIMKKSQNFQDRMKAYSNRMGLPNDTKIYMMNSRDKHIRDALNKRGWIESAQKDSVLFHLKWVYKDNLNDYTFLQQGQLYNHFRNNQQLTNKNYLRKNIKKARLEDRPSFPLSFDVQLNDDNTIFHQNFVKFEAFKLINKIGIYLSNKQKLLYDKIMKNPLFFNNHNKKVTADKHDQKVFNLLYTSPFEDLKLVKATWQTVIYLFEYISFVAEMISKEKGISYSIFKSKKDYKQAFKSVKKIEEEFILCQEHLFKNLSPFYITEIIKMWHHSQQICNSYGLQNMWILKPTGVSRGSGITITSQLSKVIQLRYGKIVQKYIEYPLMLDCKRKFDIRQWVLVTSFQPLKAYAFKQCYARFSSVKYSNDKYENMQKHLTNYSQNKECYLRQKLRDNLSKNMPSAMAEQQLASKIGPQWQKIKQKFFQDILKTLNCCKLDIIHKQGCFQVFGFDILIDQNYRPYILQVNMSPACQQRQFLHTYLQEMAEGLVNMIEGGQPTSWIQLSQNTNKNNRILQNQQKVIFIQKWWKNKLKIRKNSKQMIISEL